MRRVDYDRDQHRVYARGRSQSAELVALWMDLVAEHAPRVRPLRVLDLGCGTGRYSGALADRLDARVTAVDPSVKMLEVARREGAHPRVVYEQGSGERIPLADGECQLAFLSMVLHHIENLDACGAELARVLASGGRVFMRSCFGGRLDDIPFYRFFPAARAVDDERMPSVERVRTAFGGAGFREVAFRTVHQQIDVSLRVHLERLRHGAVSTLELISAEDREAGFAAMARAVAMETGQSPVTEAIDVLVFGKTA